MKLRFIAVTFNFLIYSTFFLSILLTFVYVDISRGLPEYKDLIEKQSPSLTRYFSDDGFVIHEEYEQYSREEEASYVITDVDYDDFHVEEEQELERYTDLGYAQDAFNKHIRGL